MRYKIVIAGGTGFIGNYLEARFRNAGNEVIIISRAKGKTSGNKCFSRLSCLTPGK